EAAPAPAPALWRRFGRPAAAARRSDSSFRHRRSFFLLQKFFIFQVAVGPRGYFHHQRIIDAPGGLRVPARTGLTQTDGEVLQRHDSGQCRNVADEAPELVI